MAMRMKDTKSLFFLKNSLSAIVYSMKGMYTVIDLRNETYVRGKIHEVDGYMNVELVDCIFCNQRGDLYPFSVFYIKNRNIRSVHIPSNCTAESLLEKAFVPRQKQKFSKRGTLKDSRARRYQQEILDEINTQLKS